MRLVLRESTENTALSAASAWTEPPVHPTQAAASVPLVRLSEWFMLTLSIQTTQNNYVNRIEIFQNPQFTIMKILMSNSVAWTRFLES